VAVVPCPATSHPKLLEILTDFSMETLMPEPTTPKAALRAAMVENFPAPPAKEGIKHRCDTHKNGSDGYKIGAHRPAENVHVAEKYTTAVAIAALRMRKLDLEEGQTKCKTEWTGEIKLEPWDGDKERSILSYMHHVMKYVPAGKLRETVTAIVARLGGHRLVEDQPIMWLPAEGIPLFKQIKARIEEASAKTDHHGVEVPPTQIHVLSIVADEEMARTVISMLVGVVDREVARVDARLAQPALSVEQASNDINKAMAVREELERYETLLERPLTALKEKTQGLVVSIANKTMEKCVLNM